MRISITQAMSEMREGFLVSTQLTTALCDWINSAGIDDGKLLPTSHRGKDISIWVNCLKSKSLEAWEHGVLPVEGTALLKIWSKLVKPRGFDSLEYYIRFRREAFDLSNDHLDVFVTGMLQAITFLKSEKGIQFLCLDDASFKQDFIDYVRSSSGRFKVEEQFIKQVSVLGIDEENLLIIL